MTWQENFRIQGYTCFAGMTPPRLITAAMEIIESDLTTNYVSERQSEYDNASYCPDIAGAPPIMDLVLKSPVYGIVDEVLGVDNIYWSKGQIAIRRAHNSDEAVKPQPHIDGFATGLNGVPADRIYNHTLLVGIFLTPLVNPFAGNFTVWPGSHYAYERYFRERGNRAMRESMPTPEIGEPVQLLCNTGDVVLAHYHLGHTASVNMTGTDRIAVYFRIRLRSTDADNWHYLTNLWSGWSL